MTQNPFEALGMGGEGGFDLGALFQQAQAMQEQLQSAQERLADAIVEGTVAGGSVTVKVTGVGELVSVDIKQGEFDGNEPDDLEDLGALIVAAYRDAKSQADALASQALGPISGAFGSADIEQSGSADIEQSGSADIEQSGGGLPGESGGSPGQLGF